MKQESGENIWGGDREKTSYIKEVVGIEFGEPMSPPGGDPVAVCALSQSSEREVQIESTMWSV